MLLLLLRRLEYWYWRRPVFWTAVAAAGAVSWAAYRPVPAGVWAGTLAVACLLVLTPLRPLAGCLARLNRFPEAATYYRKFLQLAPNDPAVPTIRKALHDYENSK